MTDSLPPHDPDRPNIPIIHAGEPPAWDGTFNCVIANYTLNSDVYEAEIDGANYAWDLGVLAYCANQGQGELVSLALTQQAKEALANSKTEIEEAFLDSLACDPRQPIFAALMSGKLFVLDGNHRVRKAIRLGWAEIPAYVFGEEVEKQCRISSLQQTVVIDGVLHLMEPKIRSRHTPEETAHYRAAYGSARKE